MQMATTASIRRRLPIATLAISTEWSPKIPEPGAIPRSEIKFLAFFTLAVCLATTLPYAAGHLVSVPGTVFTDVLEHGLDSNNYLAYSPTRSCTTLSLTHSHSRSYLATYLNLKNLHDIFQP